MAPLISLEEVKKHRHKDSVWMIIHNDIYDVTSFLEEHPGGEDSLMDFAGKDGTQGFEDVGHSDDARELMKKYKIGSLSPDDRTKDVTPYSKSKTRKRLSCPHIPKMEKAEKTWRTFDGPASSRPVALKSECKIPTTPRTERRVQSITVPRESSNLKWALLALAGALVLGIVLKKYLGSK